MSRHATIDRNFKKHLGMLFLSLAAMLSSCTVAHAETTLERVLARGELVVSTRNDRTTYYQGPFGPAGFEYDLARAFADFLSVDLRIVTPSDLPTAFSMVARGEADLAAGFAITSARTEQFRFGPVYQEIRQQVLYRLGDKRPTTITDIVGTQIEVTAGSSHTDRLEELKQQYPDINWVAHKRKSSAELIDLLHQGVIDYTIVNSNMVALKQIFYPELGVAFDLAEPQQLAWAFSKTADDSLYNQAVAFFEEINRNGILKQITARYYEHTRELDYVSVRTFMRHMTERLHKHRPWFEKAAVEFGIDWRLLAAVSYQESLWNPAAVSPTGVRGLMMLTLSTAREVGIKNRLDPKQSISGGAKYLTIVKQRIPERIAEPDRTWMALAAYNVGFGHLEDARILTQKLGGNPDKWFEVKQRLPLLAQPNWYKQTRFGHARGYEPVKYVQNIRNYYDILVWFTDKEQRSNKIQIEVHADSLPPAQEDVRSIISRPQPAHGSATL